MITPKGKLMVIGGAIDTGSFTEKNYHEDVQNNLNFFEKGILRRIITESVKGADSRIEIVPTASQIPEDVGAEYIKAFSFLGAKNVDVLNISNRDGANDINNCARLTAADVLIFTGGDQLRLSSILGGSDFHTILLNKYWHEEFLIMGTSAGAAASSNSMIYQGSAAEALLKGEVKITSGLGFINNVIIDTHFVHRGRFGRLMQAVATNPMMLGIGLGEDTGLLIKNATDMEAIGSGLVILVDGKSIKHTNIYDIEMGQPISIENLILHVMAKGDHYDLSNHKFTFIKAKQQSHEH